MDTRVFKDNTYTVRIPLLQRRGNGAQPQTAATGLTVAAFFAAAEGGAAIGPGVSITLTEDPTIPGLYGGDITGAGITAEMFTGARNYDKQYVWLRLVDPATRLNLSLRRTAYALRTA